MWTRHTLRRAVSVPPPHTHTHTPHRAPERGSRHGVTFGAETLPAGGVPPPGGLWERAVIVFAIYFLRSGREPVIFVDVPAVLRVWCTEMWKCAAADESRAEHNHPMPLISICRWLQGSRMSPHRSANQQIIPLLCRRRRWKSKQCVSVAARLLYACKKLNSRFSRVYKL